MPNYGLWPLVLILGAFSYTTWTWPLNWTSVLLGVGAVIMVGVSVWDTKRMIKEEWEVLQTFKKGDT